jgi:hypothetical protein
MLDDILEGFLQDAVETEGDLRWQRFRDVLEMHVNRDAVPIRQLFAEAGHRCFQPYEFELRGMQAVRQRLNIGRKIPDLSVDFPSPARDRLLKTEDSASGYRDAYRAAQSVG